MKKRLIRYYAVIVEILFIVYNLIFKNLIIGGRLYQIMMSLLIMINMPVIAIFHKEIKYKSAVCVIYSLIWISSKNVLQCYFNFSNIIILCIMGFRESKFMKMFSISISIVTTIFFLPLYFIFLLWIGTNINEESRRTDIYEDMHYYCENNDEVYTYSAGMMDKFHYSIGKYYEILNIDDIIWISYHERNEVSKNKYEEYLKTNYCQLKGGDSNGSK